MSTIDLSLYGCPMHYIKAREALQLVELDQTLLLLVNNGEAVDDVLKSLRHDRHICDVLSEDKSLTTIKVTKKL